MWWGDKYPCFSKKQEVVVTLMYILDKSPGLKTSPGSIIFIAAMLLVRGRGQFQFKCVNVSPSTNMLLPVFSFQEPKSRVVQLEERVAKVKTSYSEALRNLEQISEQIHAQRGRVRASRGCPVVCGGRNSPVGAEAEVRPSSGICIGSSYVGVGGTESNWADGEKTRLWVERHRESGWGQRERLEAERAASDCMSVISLQTIASDLEKCDSVEHLGDLSDAGSMLADEWERDRKPSGKRVSREVVVVQLQQVEEGAVSEEKQESFIKQHHRSVSL